MASIVPARFAKTLLLIRCKKTFFDQNLRTQWMTFRAVWMPKYNQNTKSTLALSCRCRFCLSEVFWSILPTLRTRTNTSQNSVPASFVFSWLSLPLFTRCVWHTVTSTAVLVGLVVAKAMLDFERIGNKSHKMKPRFQFFVLQGRSVTLITVSRVYLFVI